MSRCSGITRSGGRCTHTAKGPSGFCHLHDPDRAAERKRNASKAGRARPSREVVGVKDRLLELAEQVVGGTVLPGRAAVASQLYNAALRAMTLERDVRDQEDLLARLEILEHLDAERSTG